MPSRSAKFHGPGSWRRVWLPLAVLCLIPFGAGVSSAIAKEPFRIHENLAYGPSLGERGENLLDLYLPRKESARPRPLVVWVHGGGWYQGSKKSGALEKAREFVRRGYIFASVSYRLSPFVERDMGFPRDRIRHPAAAVDTARAVAWLSARARRFGGDGRRIILIGHSAGGQIVSLLGSNPRYLSVAGMNPARLRGVIALDPVGLDLEPLANAPDDPAEEHKSITYRKIVWNAFAAPWEPDFEAIIFNASPVNHADPSDPPFLTVTSATSALRTSEGVAMAGGLGQMPAFGTWNVGLGHRDINLRFGSANSDQGITRRAFHFARWVVSPRPARAVVRGRHAYRIGRTRSRVPVRLKLNMHPKDAWGICRVNRTAPFRCRSSVRLAAGQGRYRLVARVVEPTGRLGRPTVFGFKVLPKPRR